MRGRTPRTDFRREVFRRLRFGVFEVSECFAALARLVGVFLVLSFVRAI